ncbi:DUF5133 domain-containing protein [Streptomyces sp. MST-110588]|uniref:DUF5133 domain-containing protein n=1 Tax=Streptomyces sp. MST-110588 TaxID=2833628 RepID=UPI001F5D416B|nr:DUF5133 domain-containing protein [Streptomyces sp. MST-110588]UNO38840.1 DUF5133 domain-containing protein [Streptomyces sp. MST-110588]
MLMAHPVVLRNLVEQYETLQILQASDGSPALRQRLDDIAYTLCVSTGTRDVDAALIAARYRLPGARVTDDSLLQDKEATALRSSDGSASAARN